jgi:hypothetical protein
MDDLNRLPALAPMPPRLRVLQSALAIAVFSLVPLWPANGQAACPAGTMECPVLVSASVR